MLPALGSSDARKESLGGSRGAVDLVSFSDQVYASLGKLYVKDTFATGVDEVTRIFAENLLTEDEVAQFVKCLLRELQSSALQSLQSRVELSNLLSLTVSLLGGAMLGSEGLSRAASVLLERLRGESDKHAQEALCETLGVMAAEACTVRKPLGDKTPNLQALSPRQALDVLVVPLFKLMRSLDVQAQRAGAQALRAVLGGLADTEMLRSHETQMVTPLLQFLAKNDFGGRLDALETLRLLAERLGALNACHGAAVHALNAMKDADWALRKTGAKLATVLLTQRPQPDNAPELRAQLLALRHDKIDVVRAAANNATTKLPV